jgi:hypothetical protein
VLDARAADPHAVARPEIRHDDRAAAVLEPGVHAADGRIVEDEVGARAAADHELPSRRQRRQARGSSGGREAQDHVAERRADGVDVERGRGAEEVSVGLHDRDVDDRPRRLREFVRR